MDKNRLGKEIMENLLVVSSSPHDHSPLTTQKIMALVLLALVPAGFVGFCCFGVRVVLVMATCVLSCVASEFLWCCFTKKAHTISDLSACVTGLLLAYNLPPSVPLWMCACGSAFAIIIVKELFGGLGCNVVNPALAARAAMLSSWPLAMTSWSSPKSVTSIRAVTRYSLDAMSSATPLALVKESVATQLPRKLYMLLGKTSGCIGETSEIAIIIGGLFLLYKDVIKVHIPLFYILTVAIFTAIFDDMPVIYHVLNGGLLLGAVFMATDYVTSPVTKKGQIIFAIGCGLLTSIIRLWGAYPEGVSYSILIMNLTVPLIDKITKPRIFGEKRGAKDA